MNDYDIIREGECDYNHGYDTYDANEYASMVNELRNYSDIIRVTDYDSPYRYCDFR
jgi:hypothetical protein